MSNKKNGNNGRTLAMCTEGLYQLFNPAAKGQPDLDSFMRIADLIAEVGYNAIEVVAPCLSPDFLTERFREEEAPKFRTEAEERGLRIIAMHWLLARVQGVHLTSSNLAVQENTRVAIKQLIRLAAALGCQCVVHGSPAQRNLSGLVSHADGMRIAANIYKNVMPNVENLGVKVCFEQLSRNETDFITTPADMMEIVQTVGHRHFVPHLDIKALYPACQTPEEVAYLIKRLFHDTHVSFGHCHVNDPTNMSGPGTGDWDLEPIFAALAEIGYTGPISVEIFDFTNRKDFDQNAFLKVAKKSLACLHKNLR